MREIDFHPDNCKIYTPEEIANSMIDELDILWDEDIKILEPAVGTGNIFIPLLKKFLDYYFGFPEEFILKKMKKTFWVFDVDKDSINELEEHITNLCKDYNITYKNEINIEHMNILKGKIKRKYDYIISNPPYISKKNLSNQQRELLKESKTCKKYNYDLYFYFFEKSIDVLKKNGTLVFITPNTYLNSVSAQDLRKEILQNTKLCKVINFPNENIFPNALVKVCITKLKKENKSNFYNYIEFDKGILIMDTQKKVDVNNLLSNSQKVNSDKTTLGNLFYISGGIASLNDKFFILKKNEILKETKKYVFFRKEGLEHKVEKELIKDVIRPRKEKVIEKIIYPYLKDSIKIEKKIIKEKYPEYYKYYKSSKFSKDLYYGRSQGLRYLNKEKIVFPKITSTFKPHLSKDELIISGIYFVPLNTEGQKAKTIITNNYSNILKEIKNHCKNHGSNTYTINTTVLKKLSIDSLK